METICLRLYENGTILVSAYSNDGVLSFPAMFKSVIGVDSNSALPKGRYIYVDSVVNIVMGSKRWQLPGFCGEYREVSGNSFLAPEITAKVYHWFCQGVPQGKIFEKLKECAVQKLPDKKLNKDCSKKSVKISKAIVYPFNKEVGALARNENLLNYEIAGYYDHPALGKIGTHIGEYLHCDSQKLIDSIDKVDWKDDFDTVILSHANRLSELLHMDVKASIVAKCLEYRKNLYLFDEDERIGTLCFENLKKAFEDKGVWIKRPDKEIDIHTEWGGKLYDTACPVLCVAGTGSKQGKYTVQIALRKYLKKLGINVSNLGTEPSAELLGFEGMYTIGYQANMPYNGWRNVIAVNYRLHQVEEADPDLIVTGLQAETVPPGAAAFERYPIKQQEFLMGCAADAYILCTNANDSATLLRRTIHYLESIFPSRVIGICIDDVSFPISWAKKQKVLIRNRLLFFRKSYFLSRERDLERMAGHCLRYYKN